MKKRIWELDAFRGLCILGMVTVHFVFDVVTLYALIDWEYPPLFSFIQNWGGVVFLLISGVSATLGSRSARRGLIVLGCGAVVSGVTLGMYLLGIANKSILIYFGVLQCLGICMLLWPLFRRCPSWLLLTVGGLFAAIGVYLLQIVPVDFPWLVWLGFTFPGFATADYFPLLPHLGFFLLGAVIGRTVYKEKRSLFPGVSLKNPAVRFLSFFGRHSLLIYMLHQPVIAGIVWVVSQVL